MAEAGVFGKRDQQSGAMASPFVGTPLGLGQCFDRGAVRSICLDDTYPAERPAQIRTPHPAPADPCRETLSDSERRTITAVGQVLSMSRHRGIVPPATGSPSACPHASSAYPPNPLKPLLINQVGTIGSPGWVPEGLINSGWAIRCSAAAPDPPQER